MQGKNIVIIEDEVALAQALEQSLVAQGALCHVVGNGDDAVTTVKEVDADLVLLDLMIPGTTGEYVLQALRQQEGRESLPIVVLTNFDDVTSVQEQSEVDEYLAYMVKANSSLEEITAVVTRMI